MEIQPKNAILNPLKISCAQRYFRDFQLMNNWTIPKQFWLTL